jgi:hypothetical protein
LNTKVSIACIIHCVIVLAGFMQNTVAGVVLSIFLLLNIIGVVLILIHKVKTGSILFLVGSLGFIPIGLLGAIGARNNLDKLKEQEFKEKLTKLNI